MKNSYEINFIFNRWEENHIVKVIEPFSKIDNNVSNPFGTYEENINWKENSKASLSFKIIKRVQGKLNPYFAYIANGQDLQLFYDNKYFEFVITNITPKFYKENVEYQVECEDAFSFYLSRSNIGYNYKDEEDSTDLIWSGKILSSLVDKILEKGHLTTQWELHRSNRTYGGSPAFPATIYGLNTTIENTCTLSLEGSNTYNALVETALLFGANIEVTYPKDPNQKRIIFFRNKSVARNSYITLDQSSTLNDLGVSNDSEEFCTVLFVEGGETSTGEIVTLLPSISTPIRERLQNFFTSVESEEKKLFNDIGCDSNIINKLDKEKYNVISEVIKSITGEESFRNSCKMVPSMSSMLYDFSYLEEIYKIPRLAREALETKLRGDYFDSNLRLKIYAEAYYNLLRTYTRQIQQEEEIIIKIAQAYRSLSDIRSGAVENSRVSIPLNSSELINGNANFEETSCDIGSENSFISMTSEEYYLSIIESAYQELWSLWCNDQKDNNYMQTQFDYHNEEDKDFIDKRIGDLSEKNKSIAMDDLGTLSNQADTALGKLSSFLKIVEKIGININKDGLDVPAEGDEITKLFPSISYVAVNDIYYIGVKENFWEKLLLFEKCLRGLPFNNNGETWTVSGIGTQYQADYSVIREEINELILKLGLVYYAIDSNEDYILNKTDKVIKTIYEGYYSTYIKALLTLKIFCTCKKISDGDIYKYEYFAGENKRFLITNPSTGAWVDRLNLNYANSKKKGLNWGEFYNNALKEQEKQWEDIINNFGQFIIEGVYTDDSQLDAEGLFTAAQTQFVKMKRPQHNYSVKTLGWEVVKNYFYMLPEIGDIIAIKHLDLELFNRGQTSKTIVVRCQIPSETMKYQKGYIVIGGGEEEETTVISSNVPFNLNNNWYIDFPIETKEYKNVPSDFNFIKKVCWSFKKEISYQKSSYVSLYNGEYVGKIKISFVDPDAIVNRTQEFEFKISEEGLSSTENFNYAGTIDDHYSFSIDFRVDNEKMSIDSGSFKLLKDGAETNAGQEYILYNAQFKPTNKPDTYSDVITSFIVKDERNIENSITEISQNLRDNSLSITLSNQQAVEKIVKKLLRSIRYY